MVFSFDRYLKRNKLKNRDDVFEINDEIEVWPKMVESIYRFILKNNKYK